MGLFLTAASIGTAIYLARKKKPAMLAPTQISTQEMLDKVERNERLASEQSMQFQQETAPSQPKAATLLKRIEAQVGSLKDGKIRTDPVSGHQFIELSPYLIKRNGTSGAILKIERGDLNAKDQVVFTVLYP